MLKYLIRVHSPMVLRRCHSNPLEVRSRKKPKMFQPDMPLPINPRL